MKAVVLDIDGTLIESMAIDSDLYFSSISAVLGSVEIRENLNLALVLVASRHTIVLPSKSSGLLLPVMVAFGPHRPVGC